MKILFIIGSLEAGGKERQCIELIKGLLKYDVNCDLILLKNKIDYSDIYKFKSKLIILDKEKYSKLALIKKLSGVLRNSNPDIVQSWDIQSAVLAGPLTYRLKLKHINYSIQYAKKINIFSILGLMANFSFLFSNKVISNSKSGLKAHSLKHNDKNLYIYNGYDFNRTQINESKESLKKKLKISDNYIIGMVANFLDSKDYNSFIISTQKVIDKIENVSVIMIGEGYNLEKMKTLVSTKNKNKYLFLGKITEVEEIINIFDVQCLICNTKGHAEGISNSIIEGMAMGKPIIATDSGGNSEIVVHNKTGYIINAFDINMLSDRLVYLIENQIDRYQFGNAGKKRIEANFSLDIFTNKFLELYKNMLK